MHLPHRPSHGVIAGYAGLLLGTLAVAGGPAFAAGLINGHNLKRGSVTSTKLGAHSVTAAKIKPGAVTAAALGKNAVTGANIQDRSLGLVDLSVAARASLTAGPAAAGSVMSENIANGAITGEKLAFGGVGSAAIADGAITTPKLAEGAATGSKIPARVVSFAGQAGALTVGSASVSCPVGKQALGGGVDLDDQPFPVGGIVPLVTVSAPIFGLDNIPTGWTAEVNNPDTAIAAQFTVYAICA